MESLHSALQLGPMFGRGVRPIAQTDFTILGSFTEYYCFDHNFPNYPNATLFVNWFCLLTSPSQQVGTELACTWHPSVCYSDELYSLVM